MLLSRGLPIADIFPCHSVGSDVVEDDIMYFHELLELDDVPKDEKVLDCELVEETVDYVAAIRESDYDPLKILAKDLDRKQLKAIISDLFTYRKFPEQIVQMTDAELERELTKQNPSLKAMYKDLLRAEFKRPSDVIIVAKHIYKNFLDRQKNAVLSAQMKGAAQVERVFDHTKLKELLDAYVQCFTNAVQRRRLQDSYYDCKKDISVFQAFKDKLSKHIDSLSKEQSKSKDPDVYTTPKADEDALVAKSAALLEMRLLHDCEVTTTFLVDEIIQQDLWSEQGFLHLTKDTFPVDRVVTPKVKHLSQLDHAAWRKYQANPEQPELTETQKAERVLEIEDEGEEEEQEEDLDHSSSSSEDLDISEVTESPEQVAHLSPNVDIEEFLEACQPLVGHEDFKEDYPLKDFYQHRQQYIYDCPTITRFDHLLANGPLIELYNDFYAMTDKNTKPLVFGWPKKSESQSGESSLRIQEQTETVAPMVTSTPVSNRDQDATRVVLFENEPLVSIKQQLLGKKKSSLVRQDAVAQDLDSDEFNFSIPVAQVSPKEEEGNEALYKAQLRELKRKQESQEQLESKMDYLGNTFNELRRNTIHTAAAYTDDRQKQFESLFETVHAVQVDDVDNYALAQQQKVLAVLTDLVGCMECMNFEPDTEGREDLLDLVVHKVRSYVLHDDLVEQKHRLCERLKLLNDQYQERLTFVQNIDERRQILEDTKGQPVDPRGISPPPEGTEDLPPDHEEEGWEYKVSISDAHPPYRKEFLLKNIRNKKEAFCKNPYELGVFKYFKVKLRLKPDHKVVTQKYRSFHPKDEPVVESAIDKLVKQTAVRPSISGWASNLVLVRRKLNNGKIKARICYDGRAVNMQLQTVAWMSLSKRSFRCSTC